MNNNDFSSTFTWVLEGNNNTIQQQPTNKSQEQFGLSDADLFKFLLGEEAQQAVMSENKFIHNTAMEEDSSASEDGHPSMEEYVYKQNNKKSVSQPPIITSTTSRLDFRPINDFIPESQLKAMTSKERRQLRNKISARNFRNRRKEYVGTLEDELNQQKAENSQLKLEIKWVKAKMEKLQKENDKLGLDLVLGGIVLPSPPQQPQNSPYLIDSTLNLTSSSDESNLSSPPNLFNDFPDNWDFVLPQQQQQQDTYLSHALVPNWNINQVLSKETSIVPSTNNQLLLQQYPLLAPALMSIVLTHTMTMSTDEILATAKLSPEQTNEVVPYMSNKEAQAVWNILEPLAMMNDRNAKLSAGADTDDDADDDADANTATATITEEEKNVKEKKNKDDSPIIQKFTEAYFKAVLPICPVAWFQDRVCKHLCEYAANHCEEEKRQAPIVRKRLLCRQFEKAKRYITTCQ